MSKEQRIEGATLIEKEIGSAFSKAGKEVSGIEWISGNGGGLLDGDTLTVIVHTSSKDQQMNNISREAIEDFPAGVGNEKLIAHIHKMACN